ncbi:MAG: 30S ribosomal protein S12 methylthiotransferase RimO [FCB group bacterium]|nr:30S ribosomal protein S12 methylthiotransferase RimO [FCB group bacterium]
MKTFYIHKLGCPKNDVDADYISGFLQQQQMLPTDNPDQADLLIINSCAFIQSAKEESIEAALKLAQLKEIGSEKKLILTGCLSQRYAEDLQKQMPELDGIFGLNNITDIPLIFEGKKGRVIARSENLRHFPEYDFRRTVNPDEVYGYLKISDGCDNRCSYCAIPDIRGPFRSRKIENIVDEARMLVDSGKSELILVSQESSAYGRDLYNRPQLLKLLDALGAIPGDFWLRIMYLHPARLQPELIEYMIDNSRICSYFDLPLQHISDRILKRMNRRVTRLQIEKLLERIRLHGDRVAVRTTFIVGFPGETDKEFDELAAFAAEQRFDRMGAFVYSAEEDTPASTLDRGIDEETAQDRYSQLMMMQQDIAFELNVEEKGRQLEVLVETVDKENGFSIGRTRYDAPEIDQSVRLDFVDAAPGSIVPALITGCDGYDLLGRKG